MKVEISDGFIENKKSGYFKKESSYNRIGK